MIAAAGQEAQRKFDPGSVEPHQSAGDWDDVYESLETLTVLREETADTIRADVITRTVEVLTDPLVWQVVTAIAKGLLESETLKSQEVTTIIRQTVCHV